MNRLLVIGGTGFIGYHLSQKAKSKGWKVTSVSLGIPKIKRRIKGVKYIKLDITKKNQIKKKLLDNFTYVVNLGGHTSNINKKKYQKKIYDSHLKGSTNLMNFFVKKNIQSFVQVGSSAEYGLTSSPQKENDKCKPANIYGIAKLRATNYLLKLTKSKNFKGNVLRFFQVYGPRQGQTRVVPQILYSCYKNKIFPTSDGKQIRDFCYIDDATKSIFKILNKKRVYGQIFNIGYGKGISIKSLIHEIQKITKSGTPVYGKLKERNYENLRLVPDIKKAKKILNWKPTISLKSGLLKTLKYIKKYER